MLHCKQKDSARARLMVEFLCHGSLEDAAPHKLPFRMRERVPPQRHLLLTCMSFGMHLVRPGIACASLTALLATIARQEASTIHAVGYGGISLGERRLRLRR
jgi:hypothetical protein